MMDEALSKLQQSHRGQLIGPTDPDYDAARAVYNGMIDKRPRLIARCVDVADVIAAIDPDPKHADALKAWGRNYWKAVHPFNLEGAYVNFMMDDEADGRVQASYGANYKRLAAVKATYDPDNLFRVNQNIAPAAS